jgi:prepilin-type N-terminal cleavage/methylation domain-containing protein
MNRSPKVQAGFTLIEIMVTVAIIAILTTFIFGAIDAARSKARDARRLTDIKQLQGAVENYFSSCYTFPESLNDIRDGTIKCASYRPVLAEFPTDPLPPNADYMYYTDPEDDIPVTGKRYHLCAELENVYATTSNNGSFGPGKAGKAPFNAGEDQCDGRNARVFDIAGGVY